MHGPPNGAQSSLTGSTSLIHLTTPTVKRQSTHNPRKITVALFKPLQKVVMTLIKRPGSLLQPAVVKSLETLGSHICHAMFHPCLMRSACTPKIFSTTHTYFSGARPRRWRSGVISEIKQQTTSWNGEPGRRWTSFKSIY